MRKFLLSGFLVAVAIGLTGTALAQSTVVPGHQKDRYDQDGNGIPDEDVTVNGHYTSVFAYEGEYGDGAYPQNDWYWDLGDGRVYGTVESIDDLNQSTLTVCDYVVNYRGQFDNDPFLDSGWIQNHINCQGYDDNGHYNTLIVHKSDPRYTGEKPEAFGGDWEYAVDTRSGQGNVANPQRHMD